MQLQSLHLLLPPPPLQTDGYPEQQYSFTKFDLILFNVLRRRKI